MNKGALIVVPVSKTIPLLLPVALSPLILGGASVTLRSMVMGILNPIGCSLNNSWVMTVLGLRKRPCGPTVSAVILNLWEGSSASENHHSPRLLYKYLTSLVFISASDTFSD